MSSGLQLVTRFIVGLTPPGFSRLGAVRKSQSVFDAAELVLQPFRVLDGALPMSRPTLSRSADRLNKATRVSPAARAASKRTYAAALCTSAAAAL